MKKTRIKEMLKNFQPRLIIDDHFDEIKNQIDIKTETLLSDQSLSETDKKTLNDLRDEQLDAIKSIQDRNFTNLMSKHDDADTFQLQWTNVIENSSMKYEKKLEAIKKDLIILDCVLIEDDNYKSGLSLWITPWFYNEKHRGFLR